MLSSDKYAGGVVGWRKSGAADDDVDEDQVLAGALVDETLVSSDRSAALRASLGPDGRICWRRAADVTAEFNRTATMSQMASMLKDGHRNAAYKASITAAVRGATTALGRPPVVLDIGAGTGLLSLFAAEAGASKVFAVEQWPVMAEIASSVAKANPAVGAVVEVISAHSASLTAVGVSSAAGAAGAATGGAGTGDAAAAGDDDTAEEEEAATPAASVVLSPAPDLVISEILDSALLGEGVVPSLKHAYGSLLAAPKPAAAAASASGSGSAPSLCCVPQGATIYAQLVHSDVFDAWQDSGRAKGGNATGAEGSDEPPVALARRDWHDKCGMSPVAVPVQYEQLAPAPTAASAPFVAHRQGFTPHALAAPVPVAGDTSASSDGPTAAGAAAGAASVASDALAGASASAAASTRNHTQDVVLRVPAAAADSLANAVVYWWRCELFPTGAGAGGASSDAATATAAAGWYCTCPPCVRAQGWQDHWVQCVVPLGQSINAAPAPLGGAAHASGPAPSSLPVASAECWSVRAEAAAASAAAAALGSDAVSPSFAVAVLPHDMVVRFAVASGDAEVWPSKRERNAAVKAGRAPKVCAHPLLFTEPEPCTCGLHAITNYERRWALADSARAMALHAAVDDALRQLVEEHGCGGGEEPLTVVALGANSLAGVAACSVACGLVSQAMVNAAAVLCVEDGPSDAVHTTALLEQTFPAELAAVLDASRIGKSDDDDDDDEEGGEEEEGAEAIDAGAGPSTLQEAIVQKLSTHFGVANPIDALVMEGIFSNMAHAPLWCALAAWFRRSALSTALAPHARILPAKARVIARLYSLPDLYHRSHGVVGTVCGFDHAAFDAVESRWHTHLFTYPLWQYRRQPLSEAVTIATLDLTERSPFHAADGTWAASADGDAPQSISFAASIPLASASGAGGADGGELSHPHAVVIWVDYDLTVDGSAVLHADPEAAPYHRQHVKFLPPALASALAAPATGGATPATITVALTVTAAATPGEAGDRTASFAVELS